MSRPRKLEKMRKEINDSLLVYGCAVLKDKWLEDDVEELVKKTLDKFENDCYNVLRKKRKE